MGCRAPRLSARDVSVIVTHGRYVMVVQSGAEQHTAHLESSAVNVIVYPCSQVVDEHHSDALPRLSPQYSLLCDRQQLNQLYITEASAALVSHTSSLVPMAPLHVKLTVTAVTRRSVTAFQATKR